MACRHALTAVAILLTLGLLTLASSRDAGATNDAVVGNFQITFQGAVHDGQATEFTYCVTGLDQPDFRALSNWMVSLDPACVSSDLLVGCGPAPCLYQKDDPNLGLTGVKFDDLEVEKGQTACFSFRLSGNWTLLVGDVNVGLKAANATFFGDVTGPICPFCGLAVRVVGNAAGRWVSIELHHRRPTTATTFATFSIIDSAGTEVRKWRSPQFTIHFNEALRKSSKVPGDLLPPGSYTLITTLGGMSRISTIRTQFDVE